MRALMTRFALAGSAAALALLSSPLTFADQPLTQLSTWSGSLDFFATGAPLAEDGADGDTTLVDTLLASASVDVSTTNVLAGAELVAAYIYWGGSIVNDDCVGANIDDAVDFTPPGAATPTAVTADACYCSDAGAFGYDVQLCRADVTSLVTTINGTYTVGGFAALIENSSTNNASFSLVLVYEDGTLPPRRIGLWDGVQTMHVDENATEVITLSGLDIDSPPQGDLTWYALEGDFGGSEGESVSVAGVPGGGSVVLGDALNPTTNPMNHTINTTTPPQDFSIGVDIDRFDITAALANTDTAVEMTYTAGDDKYWIAYNIVGVNVFEPFFGADSNKSWALEIDADANATPSVGDTVRYTVELVNTGTAVGVVDVDDLIPAEAASWQLVDAGGGADASTTSALAVNGITVAAGAAEEVVFDVVLADVPDETVMANTADFDATPDGDAGSLVAPDVTIRRDADADTVFDNDDNCPADPNPGQEDGDNDGLGDACDTSGSGGVGGTGAGGAAVGGAGGQPSSDGGATGTGGSKNTDDDTISDDGSCACNLVGASSAGTWPLWLTAALTLALRRRRRA